MGTKIDPNYQPSERVYQLLTPLLGSIERAREFVGHEMGAFMLYWEGTGKPKVNWDSTCLNWMKRTYEDKKEAMARNRSFGKQQGNIFEETLAGQIAGDKPKPEQPRRVYHKPAPEVRTGPTMSTDDALAELRKITRRNHG